MEIYPKSKKDYIHETIYLKNTSFTTRRAVIEQIISNLDPTEIRNILDEMEEYQNRLDGIEMTEYQMYSKDTRELLENLLK